MAHSKRNGLRTFADAVAIVTGAASGIGRGLARALHDKGAHVVLADLQTDAAREAARSIGQERVEVAELDVRDADAFTNLIQDVVARRGRLDYLFNNAGIGMTGEFADTDPEHWQTVLDINLMGVVNGMRAAYQPMVEQGFGHIVNTASTAGMVPMPYGSAYSASKFAVVGISRVLGTEGRHYGIRSSVICPGFVQTPILAGGGRYGTSAKNVPGDALSRLAARMRPMDPDRFANKVIPQVGRNKSVIVVPAVWKLFMLAERATPRLSEWINYQIFRQMKAEFGPSVNLER